MVRCFDADPSQYRERWRALLSERFGFSLRVLCGKQHSTTKITKNTRKVP
jgi:hypothetical protein